MPHRALAPRCCIREVHGAAEVPSVRNIDNLVVGGQNSIAGTTAAHRPTDVDGLAAQTRADAEAYPEEDLQGWPSDFKGAFKQVPAVLLFLSLLVLVQYSPALKKPIYWLPLSQVFGSKMAPINFCRYPTWFCDTVAALFAVPMSHCVDDMISVEPAKVVESGWASWRLMAELAGWELNEEKSPWPSSWFQVIGVLLDLQATPGGW